MIESSGYSNETELEYAVWTLFERFLHAHPSGRLLSECWISARSE